MKKINPLLLENALRLEFIEPKLETAEERSSRRQKEFAEMECEYTLQNYLPNVVKSSPKILSEIHLDKLMRETIPNTKQAPILKTPSMTVYSSDRYQFIENINEKYIHQIQIPTKEGVIQNHKPQTHLKSHRVSIPCLFEKNRSEKVIYKPDSELTDTVIARLNYSHSQQHPSDAHKMIEDYEKKQRSFRSQPAVDDVITILSKPTRIPKELQTVDDYLRDKPAFIGKPDYILFQLWKLMVVEKFADGQSIFRQGDPGVKWYVILSGAVDLYLNKIDMNGKPITNHIATMNAGEKFGDHALFNDLPRSASAEAQNYTVLLTLEKPYFIKLMGIIQQNLQKKMIYDLQKFFFLKDLDYPSMKIIADRIVARSFPKNTVVVKQGTLYDNVFFLKSGTCAVFKKVKYPKNIEKKLLLGYFHPKSTFNEEAINKTRKSLSPYTVVTTEECEILSIVTNGEWLNFPLKAVSTKFVTMTDEEIMYKYKVRKECGEFRKYQKRRQVHIEELERGITISEQRKSHLPPVLIPTIEIEYEEPENQSTVSEIEETVPTESLPPLPKKFEKPIPKSKDPFEFIEILSNQYFHCATPYSKAGILEQHNKFIAAINQNLSLKNQKKSSANSMSKSEPNLPLTSSEIVLASVYNPQKRNDRAFLQKVDYHSSDFVLGHLSYALNHKHPSEAHKHIQDFENKQRQARKLCSIDDIINILSKQPRSTKELQMVDDYLRTQPAFVGKPDYILVQLWKLMNVEKFESGSVIFKQGDVGLRWYVILTGSVNVYLNKGFGANGKQLVNYIATMQAGEKFGDRALFNDLPRSTTIIAGQDTVLLSLEKQHFKKLMGIAHGIFQKNLVYTLQKFKFLSHLDFSSLKLIADRFVLRQIPKGTVILQQGTVADMVFFVITGKCAVYRNVKLGKGEKKLLMGYFNPNSTFNEEVVSKGVVSKYPSPYTVVTCENCEIGSIVTAGEWMDLPLNVIPTKFVTMTEEEILYQYNVLQQCRMFRKYQKRYVEQAIRKTKKNNFK
ncbi:hypothetical protein HDV06_006533 [Boothiomyces sp. JEL0866]|nr:hypothetical protein HDV06_006533 [Boothiomyces sp. JEL0866]